ncbi:hypothetical protein B0H13DRAFT_2384686 [Mycena leptocephala]|nr:hypothetical protein B0H13DRAFT_2384686 [Mycena leptocephala]
MMKANPDDYTEQQKQAKKARAKYEERHRHTRKAKQLLRRDEASYKALGKERYYALAAKKKEGARDYDMEWLVKLMSSPMSSSQYYCMPPFHDEPQGPQEVIRRTVQCYLVVGPAAKEARGVYAEWTNAQRASEAISRGGAPKYNCYNDTIPPGMPAVKPESMHMLKSLLPPHRWHRSPLRPQSHHPLESPKSARSWQLFAHANCITFGGGGAVRTSLSEALQDLEMVAATGHATLITTQDTRYAVHIAAGHTEGQARALADGERLAEGLKSWTLGSPISGLAGARRQTRAVCISELRAALSAIELSAAESDGEEPVEAAQRFDWESD